MTAQQRDQITQGSSPPAAVRAAWIAGGLLMIVLGVALIRVTQVQVADMSEGVRLTATVVMRGATALFVGGGAWCLVRGWRPRT
ncbi:hypothetical protein [Streptomyces sp. NPDC059176]|uniref:hypothetical protein n=1 Tax=Streptomyces sp. NPDC059176 TaxID=3346758 RepID=UPI00367CBA86